jgi:hypothetical protein
MHATPVMGGTNDGTADVDCWYTTDPMSIDGMRNPKTVLMNGKFVSGNLSADAGT